MSNLRRIDQATTSAEALSYLSSACCLGYDPSYLTQEQSVAFYRALELASSQEDLDKIREFFERQHGEANRPQFELISARSTELAGS